MVRRTKPDGPSLFDSLDEVPASRGVTKPEYVDDPKDGLTAEVIKLSCCRFGGHRPKLL